MIAYNEHAGLGASIYQHDQTDLELLARVAAVTDGTSTTIALGERAASPPSASLAILMADVGVTP